MKIDHPRPFDYRAITDTIERSLANAGLASEAGMMKGITGTIHQALASAGLVAPVQRDARQEGEFLHRSFTNAAGTRAYQLHVPPSCSNPAAGAPLILMLHGCSQSADDFAAGTRMNALADRHGFLVAYPSQSGHANAAKCWSWYLERDQQRDQGEPSILAGIAREIAAAHPVDPRRIFVAGMSAGAAMAVILGARYPELFAAVGAHSGLPLGAAYDKRTAFEAMNGAAPPVDVDATRAVPTIVFHGGSDRTVVARNGSTIAGQAARVYSRTHELRVEEIEGASPGGRSYRRTVHSNAAGTPVVEHWLLHDAGHAWSGGSADGSFTDARGPDASAEMIRFFLSR